MHQEEQNETVVLNDGILITRFLFSKLLPKQCEPQTTSAENNTFCQTVVLNTVCLHTGGHCNSAQSATEVSLFHRRARNYQQ